MKTIIIRTSETDNNKKLSATVAKLERYADKQINNAVICTRFLGPDNYNTIWGELKDATALNDYDLFIIGVTHAYMDINQIQSINKAHTLTIMDDEYDSAKNYVIMV